jgi:hypothetical protein
LNVTVLAPCVAPKFVPVIVMEVPTAPEAWLRPVMVGFVDGVPVEPEPEPAHPASPITRVATRSRSHSPPRALVRAAWLLDRATRQPIGPPLLRMFVCSPFEVLKRSRGGLTRKKSLDTVLFFYSAPGYANNDGVIVGSRTWLTKGNGQGACPIMKQRMSS